MRSSTCTTLSLQASKYNANLFRAYLTDCDSCFDFSAWARSSEEVEGVLPSLLSTQPATKQSREREKGGSA